MKQVRIEGFGDVSQVHVREVAEPAAGEGEVVIAIAACSVNYADLMQREGLYVGGPTPPFAPGAEAAGTVLAVGPGVTALAVGTRIMVTARGGLQAERAVVPVASCVPIPDGLTFTQAAAFPVSFLTAFHALTTVGRAVAGELVLIHAAAGGAGTAAVQIAKLLGLRVVATASTEDKRALARSLGADHAVDYDGFETTVRELGGAAIILESIGGEILRRSLSVLAPLGRLVVFGVSSRDPRPVDTVKLLFRSHAVLGLHLDAIFARPELLLPSLDWLLARVVDGRLAIQVGHTLPLADVRHAHELLASRQSHGKVVLVP
ncbi:MAG: NADPH:quinone oxidoreductase family protein [Deltaproteobacteria bacterium]|nr:NADPH:quinone oxidoreductase family protein [Deltaproteobacteria bacterium]